jgi:hypothetical protein
MNFFKTLDSLNKLQPSVMQADNQYLRKLTPKKEKKVIVETKHPYPASK